MNMRVQVDVRGRVDPDACKDRHYFYSCYKEQPGIIGIERWVDVRAQVELRACVDSQGSTGVLGRTEAHPASLYPLFKTAPAPSRTLQQVNPM